MASFSQPDSSGTSVSRAARKRPDLLRMTQMAILLALEILMAFTPIGFLTVGIVSITLMHIPVIIGAVLLGPWGGAALGGAFGILSMLRAILMPGAALDILFNPAASGNPIGSVVMAVVPRILLGLVAGGLYLLLRRLLKTDYAAIPLSAGVASLLHSALVLGSMFLLFQGHPLMQGYTLKLVLGTIVTANGLIELAAGVVLATAICKPLLLLRQKRKAQGK